MGRKQRHCLHVERKDPWSYLSKPGKQFARQTNEIVLGKFIYLSIILCVHSTTNLILYTILFVLLYVRIYFFYI